MIRHQAQLFNAPWNPETRHIDTFFLVAGYASGKTFGDCMLALNLVRRYHMYEVMVGIGGPSLIFLKKTLLVDLFRLFNRYRVPYTFDKQSGIIQVDQMQFMCIGTENPQDIYGYNYHAFIDDEIDELPHEKAIEAKKAISERTRKVFPDGRQPFEVYSSTAQGYKGLYQIVEDLKQSGEPYVLIRGETVAAVKAGILSKKKYHSWVRMYNENERMAYLEGRFVNLTTGRVYYGYDDTRNMLKAPAFAIEPNDLVRVGQDFNVGYSRGCAVVVRGGVVHVCKLFEFKEIGHAPKMIRTAFPPNVIEWYPDASGAEIVAGYATEIREQNIECRIGTINPSIVDRIFFVNKLFETGRLVLWPGCERLAMAMKVRQYNDKGDPEKGKGPTAPDHWADSLEYVIWRIVGRDPEFRDLWTASRIGRREITDRVVT